MVSKSIPVIIKLSQDNFKDYYKATIPIKIFTQLNKDLRAELKVGSLKVTVEFAPNDTDDFLIISSHLAHRLSLHSNMKTNLIIKENQLCLGPVIGTFTDDISMRLANEQKANNKMNQLIIANKNVNTILYFFTINDFYSKEKKIKGIYYNYTTDRWERNFFPLPDVLYNRGGSILGKYPTTSKYLNQSLNNKNIKKLNPKYYFDKWDTYNKLIKYEEMKLYLPLTIQYEKPEDLCTMFEKYPILYIKDRKGKRGLGVTRVIDFYNGTFELSYFQKKLFKYTFYSFETLINEINEIYKNKKAIIQCAIDVIQINNNNVDMKPTIQRNRNGELEIVACPVRIGKAQAPAISVNSGFEVFTFEDLFLRFSTYSMEQIKDLKDRVDKFLLISTKCIEESYGTFGEIGIDFAIDKKGKIWFIECNARPGKETICLSYDENTVKKAFSNPLEYSKYICDF